MTTDHQDLGHEAPFAPSGRSHFIEGADTLKRTSGSNPVRITPEIKLAALHRELGLAARPLPGVRTIPAGTEMSDAEMIGAIDIVSVASLIRHQKPRSLLHEPSLTALIRAARGLGLAPMRTSMPTCADLRHDIENLASPVYATLPIQRRLRERTRFVATIRTFLEATGLEEHTALDAIFGGQWIALRGQVLAGSAAGKRPAMERCLQGMANRARCMIHSSSLTQTFAVALAESMSRAGVRLDALCRAAEVDYTKVRHWLGGAHPREDAVAVVARIERVLGIAAGVLCNLIEAPKTRLAGDSVLTPEVRRRLEEANIPMTLLPSDWPQLGDERKRAILAWIERNIIQKSPYRRYLRQARQHEISHVELPPLLASEFGPVRSFKSDLLPDPFFPRELTVTTGRRSIRTGGAWRVETTVPLVDYMVRRLVTMLRLRNIDTTALGAGFLCASNVHLELSRDIARRRFDLLMSIGAFPDMGIEPPKNGMVFTAGDANRTIILAGLIHPKTGYFSHNPPTLNLLPGSPPNEKPLVDQAWIAHAHRDWLGLLAQERERMVSLAKSIGDQVKKVRDPWANIEPILDLDDPMTALYGALDRMGQDRPSFFGSPTYAARHDRDHLLMSLEIAVRLRRANYGPLTYRQDRHGRDVGHLRWIPTRNWWQIVIPQSELKNIGSSALPADGSPLVMVLDPADTRLYRAIDRWLTGPGCSRRLLHGDGCGDWLFPGMGDGRICDQMISTITYHFTARYLVWTPWTASGIPGVLPFGPHSIRDIVATHVIKATRSFEAAADVLFDSPATLRKRYARLTAQEKSIRTIQIVGTSIDRPPDPHVVRKD